MRGFSFRSQIIFYYFFELSDSLISKLHCNRTLLPRVGRSQETYLYTAILYEDTMPSLLNQVSVIAIVFSGHSRMYKNAFKFSLCCT